jgi:hypothetical protein
MNQCSSEQKSARKTKNTPERVGFLPLTPCTNLLISATLIQVTILPFLVVLPNKLSLKCGNIKAIKKYKKQKIYARIMDNSMKGMT